MKLVILSIGLAFVTSCTGSASVPATTTATPETAPATTMRTNDTRPTATLGNDYNITDSPDDARHDHHDGPASAYDETGDHHRVARHVLGR